MSPTAACGPSTTCRDVRFMSASLIGRFGSSTFRPSTTGVLMSLAGSRFSSESALRPFHHGVRRRGGTIYWAALPSDEQPISANNEHPDQSGSCSSSAMCVCSYAATRFFSLANGLSPSQVCIERLRSELPVSLRRPACTSARTVVNSIQIAVMVRKSPTI